MVNKFHFLTFVRIFLNIKFYKVKKLLFSVIFIGSLTVFSEKVSAQTVSREPVAASQKSEDAVMVAYPNPARDFIIIKSKDNSLKIKSVTFYSILGMQVAEYAVNMNSGEIRLDKLRPGKYLMRYTLSDNTQKVTQIVKQ
nr:T9SS type A sorting domain-containing protein [Kaistella soli]